MATKKTVHLRTLARCLNNYMEMEEVTSEYNKSVKQPGSLTIDQVKESLRINKKLFTLRNSWFDDSECEEYIETENLPEREIMSFSEPSMTVSVSMDVETQTTLGNNLTKTVYLHMLAKCMNAEKETQALTDKYNDLVEPEAHLTEQQVIELIDKDPVFGVLYYAPKILSEGELTNFIIVGQDLPERKSVDFSSNFFTEASSTSSADDSVKNYMASASELSGALKGLRFEHIPNDGHCLFHAVGLYLGQDAQFLRQTVAAHMEQNINDFRHFRPGTEDNFRAYIKAIRSSNEWGDHIEIEILQRVTNRPIIIIRQDANPNIPDNIDDYEKEPIFIYYNGHTHYDAFTVQEGFNPREILSNIQNALEQHQDVVYNPLTPFNQRDSSPNPSDEEEAQTTRGKKRKLFDVKNTGEYVEVTCDRVTYYVPRPSRTHYGDRILGSYKRNEAQDTAEDNCRSKQLVEALLEKYDSDTVSDKLKSVSGEFLAAASKDNFSTDDVTKQEIREIYFSPVNWEDHVTVAEDEKPTKRQKTESFSPAF